MSKAEERAKLIQNVLTELRDLKHGDLYEYSINSAEEIEAELGRYIADWRARLDALLADDRWHKWPDEPPPEPGWYLLATKYEPYIEVGLWHEALQLPGLPVAPNGGWWLDYARDEVSGVTHWRPLPDPPEPAL